ncbi:hypothetical protein BaRGS_00017722 [Batillaria attramentaria]|uniref:Uncharacterized protein n=1 Tax=Batillaria attramentaria TaxID=370345 RepID=A0ABD0K2S5_9CAEN
MQTSEDGSKMFEVNIKASINMLLCGTGAQNVINFLAVLDIPLPPQGDLSLVLPVRPHDTSPLCSSSALWTSQKTSTLETLEHGFSPM